MSETLAVEPSHPDKASRSRAFLTVEETQTEAERMLALRRYDVLDTPPDGAFDRITELAAKLFDVPISIVSLVDTDRIWFKSHRGLNVNEVGREPGLCASVVLQDEAWIVTDALKDPRTLTNPLVVGELGLQFYAGFPLVTHDGHRLGTLCVIDREPRQITQEETETLRTLAGVVMDELELRLSARRLLALEEQRAEELEATAARSQRMTESAHEARNATERSARHSG